MAVESAQTLNAQRTEPCFDQAGELLAGSAGLRVASQYSQDRGTDQQRLRIVGTRSERAIERDERGDEFVAALLHCRLQHQNIGHGGLCSAQGVSTASA